MENSIIQILSLYMAELVIPVTLHSIAGKLQKHPDFPSMFSISDVLNSWNVPNAAYQLTFEELANVPAPFFAFYKNEFVLVNQSNEKNIIISNEHRRKHSMEPEEFKKSYQGTILIAEKDDTSGEKDYRIKRRIERINTLRFPFIISGGTIFELILYSNMEYTKNVINSSKNNWLNNIYLITHTKYKFQQSSYSKTLWWR